MARPTTAQIDLDAQRRNKRLASRQSPHSRNMAVIKANAYGHGAVAVARALEDLVPAFAVACLEEALELRQAGITTPLLLLEGFFHRDEIAAAAASDCWLLLENHWHIDTLIDAKLPAPVTVWLKVDTGMHRLGLQPHEARACHRKLAASPNVGGEIVVATHFACADELDNPITGEQIDRFRAAVADLGAPLSMANSPALFGWPASRADWNRAGYMLYGNSPFGRPHPEADRLDPVMTFKSRVMSLRTVPPGDFVGYGATWRADRTTRLATVPAGYGDGYPRTAKSGTPVLVNGQRATLAGRISMDLLTVDVTDIEGVELGSEVELWGKALSVEEVACGAGTIGYELLTRMPGRAPRDYVSNSGTSRLLPHPPAHVHDGSKPALSTDDLQTISLISPGLAPYT